MVHVISEREAAGRFGKGVVDEYCAEIGAYRRKTHSEAFGGGWDGYVSLPFLARMLGVDAGEICKIGGSALVLVHPGYSSYSEFAGWLAEENKSKFGDYAEYLGLLAKRIEGAKNSGERIIVYTPLDAMKETLDLVGREGLLLVPDCNAYDYYIESAILGVSFRELYGFLADSGLKDIELCGEWAIGESGGCLGYVKGIISKPEYGFNVRRGIKYPLGEADVKIPLFTMTKATITYLQVRFMEEVARAITRRK